MGFKRLFVAVHLGSEIREQIRESLVHFERSVPEGLRSGMKQVPPENWHLTISFLGSQEISAVPRIVAALRDTARSYPAPEINLQALRYGPIGGPVRMIWVLVSHETSAALRPIKTFFEERLEGLDVGFKQEHRVFSGHITLARFTSRLPGLSPQPQFDLPTSCTFIAGSLDLMESQLGRGGPHYHTLQASPFRGAV